MSAPVVNMQGGAMIVPMPLGGDATQQGGMKVKTIKKILKKNGLKTTGRKSTLVKRMRKAHLRGGQKEPEVEEDNTVVPPKVENEENNQEGGRHTAKHLKAMLKKHGLKTTGTKRALTRRARKARLL